MESIRVPSRSKRSACRDILKPNRVCNRARSAAGHGHEPPYSARPPAAGRVPVQGDHANVLTNGRWAEHPLCTG